MKKHILLLALMMAVGFSGFAQPSSQMTKTTAVQASSGNASALSFNETNHNFGKIPQGAPVTFEFEFTNTSKEPVIITNTKTSCGCTASYASEAPVKPGEKSKIKVTFNAEHAGTFSKTVTVTTSQAENNILFLLIRGEVITQVN